MPMAPCRLCKQERELRDSHIIPHFVTKWLLESSPTRGLRDLTTPNRRRQDSIKLPFLCDGCEQLLSRWETKFAERVFLPLHQNAGRTFEYDAWALKFACSVVWRVSVESLDRGYGRLSADQISAATCAEETWRAFLLGGIPHPSRFEVHAIPLDVVRGDGPGVSPFLNRYLLRAADGEVVLGTTEVLIYAKLCRVLLIGHIVVTDRARWRSSRLAVGQGVLDLDRNYYVPNALQWYMNRRAMRGAEALASQSPRQKEELLARLQSDIPRLASSEMFRAMRADVAQSGKAAFAVTGDLSADQEEIDEQQP